MPPNGYSGDAYSYSNTAPYYGGNTNIVSGDWEPSPSHLLASPRTNRDGGFELANPGEVDPEVKRQLEAGLIDANDICEDMNSDHLEGAPRQVFRRKVKKLVEVPVTRKVKVQTTEQVVVPEKLTRKVMVTKQVPVTVDKYVEEAYMDIEPRQATRMKEVWTKKMVPETYTKNVEVRKTRRVKVPETTFREVEEEKEIEVEGTRIETQPAWRVDEIKDTKMVEIEGWQEVELVPRLRDTNIRVERTFERESPRRRVERKIGTNVIGDADQRLDNVDTDSDNEPSAYTSAGVVDLDGSEARTRPSKRVRTVRSHRFLTQSMDETVEQLEQLQQPTVMMSPKHIPTPPRTPNNGSKPVANPASTPRGTKMFGLRMSSRKDGLHVTEVAEGGFAHDAGLSVGDVIVSVDEELVTSVKGWRTALSQKKNGEFLSLNIKGSDGRHRYSTVKLDDFNPAHYV